MPQESIGVCGGQSEQTGWNIAELEIGIYYIKRACGEPPPDFELEVVWNEHELGAYPTIGLSWEGLRAPPRDYLRRAEHALERLNAAVEWSAIEPQEDIADEDDEHDESETDDPDSEFAESRNVEVLSSRLSRFVAPDQLPFDVSHIIKQAVLDWEVTQPLGFTRPPNESSGDYIVAEMESAGLRRLNGETAWFRLNAAADEYRTCIFAALDHWLAAAEISTKRTPKEMDEYERPLGE